MKEQHPNRAGTESGIRTVSGADAGKQPGLSTTGAITVERGSMCQEGDRCSKTSVCVEMQ